MINLHKIEVDKIYFYISMQSMTFDFYLLYFKFNQLGLFTEVYHTFILYTAYSRLT